MADFGTMDVIDNSQVDAGVKVDTTPKVEPTTSDSKPTDTTDREISLDNVNEIFETPEKTVDTKKSSNENDEDVTEEQSSDEQSKDTNKETKQKKSSDSDKPAETEFDLDLNLEEEKEDEKESDEQPKKQGRDYTGFKLEQIKILKHIPNYLLDETKAFIKQHESITAERDQLKIELDKVKSGKLPDNYFEHEKAYLLHPKYEELSRHQEYVDYAENHWEEQMLAIEEGKNWLELQFDDKGKAKFVEHKAIGENKIDVRARLHVQKVLNALREDRNETQQQIGQITQEFKTKSETTKQSYKMIEDKFFSKLKDMSKLPPEAQAYYNAAKEYLTKQLPSYSDHKLVDFLAKAALGNVYKTQEIKKLKDTISRLTGKKKDEELAGPTSKVLSKGSGKIVNEKIYDLNNKEDLNF